ncbi:MAG: hypothetical protein Q7S22_03555 [Candidatus Micrarchaeota archaeon]|nr:hypothetical protein [Candidatus Micrarchaeota archaeon]
MAKPIEQTPTLRGKSITKFYETLHRDQTMPDPKRIEMIKKGIDVFSRISRK